MYFGISTILSSGSVSLRPKPRPEHIYTDLTKTPEIDDNGYTSPTSSKYGTLTSPTNFRDSAPSPSLEPHYEHIPAQQNGIGSAGDHYQLLQAPPPPSSPPPKGAGSKEASPKKLNLQKSGQYDKLGEGGRGKENPYITSPTRGNRDMYTLLPSSAELKTMADSYEDSDN